MSGKIVFSLFILSVIALGSVAYASVLGIDLGGEFMKISSISPGKSFVIVENTATRRKTNTAISFYNNERWFETDALYKKPRAFANTFLFINKYLGKSYDEQLIQAYKDKYVDLYNFERQEDKGTIQFAVEGFKIKDDEPMSFSVEELVSMFLRHAKLLADKQANMNIKDAVVTIPPSYGVRERYALADACQLAGLTPLAFIHENTAAALYYAIERKDENNTHTVLFYNLGATSLKVSVVEYTMENSTEKYEKNKKYESFRVLADAWEEEVGGYLFDVNLANSLAEDYDKLPSRQGKKKVREVPGAMAKLLKEANKAKEVLSANKETSVYIEALLDDQDFKMMVTRQRLEESNAEAFKLLTPSIQKVLEASGKSLTDIDAIEMLGGGLRIPKVQQILQDYLGKDKELGAHMNGDEAMALGTSFYAASLSASFKTRPIYMNDGLNYPIYATIRTLGGEDDQDEVVAEGQEKFEKNTTLFSAKQKLNSKKALAFSHDKNLKVILYTKSSNGTEDVFSTFHITKVEEAIQKRTENMSAPKISLYFKLNNLGLVELIKSEVTMEETKYVEETVVPKKGKKNATQADNETTTVEGETANSTNETESTEQASDENSTSGEPEKKLKKKIVNHSKDLSVSQIVPSHLKLSEATMKKALKGLRKIEEFEEARKKRSEAKNKLESFVYRAQELTGDDEFQAYATEEEIETLKSLALENDDWLYSDEASQASLSDFEDRYQNMTSIAQKVVFRQKEWGKRDKVIKDSYKSLEDLSTKVGGLNATKPWIKESHKDDVLSQIKKAREWLDEKVEKVADQKKNEDPVVSTNAIEVKITYIKEAFAKVKATPKPKTEKEKEREKAKAKGKGSSKESPDDFLFDMFLKHKNITISGIDDSMRTMFKNSMKGEYETWRADFMKNFTESQNAKDGASSNENKADDTKIDPDQETPQSDPTTEDQSQYNQDATASDEEPSTDNSASSDDALNPDDEL